MNPAPIRSLASIAFLAACLLSAPRLGAQQTRIDSPEVSADGKVTFRMLAPNAKEVLVKGLRNLPDQPMANDGKGLWSVTVGPLAPDLYSYTFVIDGATVTDPHDRDIKKYFSCESQVEVPGNPPILSVMQAVPHGAVHHEWYASAVRGSDAGVEIYTPPGYDPRGSARYPVVYLLHGFGDREDAWLDSGHANWIADNLIAQHRIAPCIIVMPYGHPVPVGQRDSLKDYGARNDAEMQADILGAVIPLVEREYLVKADRADRAIAGLSMGGGHSLRIGLGHPELFGYVGAFSAGAPEKDLDTLFTKVVSDPSSRPLLWIAIGRDDFLFKRNEAFNAWLDARGIKHSWLVSDGAHEWANWRAYLPQFLEAAFR
jgi:enterochelin esterase-like enzyme